jgi:hypothetical protein
LTNIIQFDTTSPKIDAESTQTGQGNKIASAVIDLINGLSETARAVKQAYRARLKRETALGIGYRDSISRDHTGPRKIAKEILLIAMPMLRGNKHRWSMVFYYDASPTRIRWSIGLTIFKGFCHLETLDFVLRICIAEDELGWRTRKRDRISPFAEHGGIRQENLGIPYDLDALIKKFQRIGAARSKGDMRRARRLFRTIKVTDFPPMPEFPMSHGVMSDPKGALFFIDHDWDDPAVMIRTGALFS